MKILVDEMPTSRGDCPFYDSGYEGCRFRRSIDEDMHIEECGAFEYNKFTERFEADPDKCDYLTEVKNG